MRLVPKDISGALSFYSSKVPPWVAHASAIGSSPAEVADYANKVAAANAARLAQNEARQAARAASDALRLAMGALSESCSAIVLKVRAKAATDGDAIYTLASIRPPSAPSPTPAPGKVTSLQTQLRTDGSLALSWKCQRTPRGGGTLYQIWRGDGDGRQMKFLGATGKKTFLDTSLPPGGSANGRLTYKIQPLRSTSKGETALFPVTFGSTQAAFAIQVKGKAAA